MFPSWHPARTFKSVVGSLGIGGDQIDRVVWINENSPILQAIFDWLFCQTLLDNFLVNRYVDESG